jgi:tRNA dimethylallyltransferase
MSDLRSENQTSKDLRKQKVVFVIGSTASGKSDWALRLAKKHNGSIVNIDSVQFYQGLVVGSAAPTEAEKNQAPHYLYNYIQAPYEMTAGEFLRDFYKLLENPNLKFPLFIVGGTGFYIQALEKGMFNIPEVSAEIKQHIEQEINEFGVEKAYAELIAFDPSTKVHANDAYRIGRALEVKRSFGKTMSELQAEFVSDEATQKYQLKNPYLKIGRLLSKDLLQTRVCRRTELMLQSGMIEEVQTFLNQGFLNWAPLKSVGYFQVLQFLTRDSESTLQNLVQEITQSTMKLIKKQKTWFKRDQTILWSDSSPESDQHVELQIDQFLAADESTI